MTGNILSEYHFIFGTVSDISKNAIKNSAKVTHFHNNNISAH